MKFDVKNEIIIAGHRGNPAKSKENTIESFKSAIDLKVDMIETDVRLTKDGIAVLMHDDDTFRTTGHKGLVRDMSFNELRKLNAGTEEKPAFIPSLEEFLKLCASSPETLMNIEIKVYKHIEGEEMVHQAVEKTVSLCEKYGLCNRVVFNSFDAYVLEYIHKKYEGKFVLHGYYPYGIMSNVSIDPSNYLDYVCYWAIDEEAKRVCEFLKLKGIEPCTGCNTTEVDFYKAVKYGCSMFTENDPEKALMWREKIEK